MARLMAKLGLGVSVAQFDNPEHVDNTVPTVTADPVAVSAPTPEGETDLNLPEDVDLGA